MLTMLSRLGAGLALMTLICSTGFAQQNLVVNGSFETPLAQDVAWPGYFVDTGVAIPGWDVNGNYGLNNNRTDAQADGQRNPFHGGGRPIPDGNQVLFIQNPGGSINTFRLQQNINGLEDGEWYQLILYTAIRPNRVPMLMRVRIGENNLNLTQSADDNYIPVTANVITEPYERHEFMFQWNSATLGGPRLRIQVRKPEEGDSTILFDNIQIRKINLEVSISGPSLVESRNNVVLTANVTGALDPEYQWYRNGVLLAGQTNSTLVLLDVTPDDSANYSVFVSDGDRTAEASIQLVVTAGLPVSNTYALLILCALMLLVALKHITRKRVL